MCLLEKKFYYNKNKFDSIRCITKKYDTIIAIDVLEHIPDYHLVVQQFIKSLNPGGIIIENSPFEESSDEISIHVRKTISMEIAMEGMERINKNTWVKL